jgi:hypothetical protein
LNSSLDPLIPNPAMHLPCENITKEANIIAKTTGLRNNISITDDVPSKILVVFADKNVRVSNGSSIIWHFSGRFHQVLQHKEFENG